MPGTPSPESKTGKFLKRFFGMSSLRPEEYRASINALNIFFGAIIGVNFSSLQELPPVDYAYVLLLTSALIALILIVSNSKRRIWSAVQLIVALAGYYYLFRIQVVIEGVTDHLLVTLGIWAASALFYEFSAQKSDDQPDERPEETRS